MTEAVRSYLLSITASALLLSAVQAILPKGAVRQAATLCGSLLILLTVLAPVSSLDQDRLAESLARIHMDTEMAETGVTVKNRELMAGIIKRQCRSYILDKAAEMELRLEVEVVLKDGPSYPYPTKVCLRGAASVEQKALLRDWIENNLGVPGDQQEWE